jgi:hypothetical protein
MQALPPSPLLSYTKRIAAVIGDVLLQYGAPKELLIPGWTATITSQIQEAIQRLTTAIILYPPNVTAQEQLPGAYHTLEQTITIVTNPTLQPSSNPPHWDAYSLAHLIATSLDGVALPPPNSPTPSLALYNLSIKSITHSRDGNNQLATIVLTTTTQL